MSSTSGDDRAPTGARILVGVALALLVIPAVVGFDRWPLTAWRLFSLARGDEQTHWVLETVDQSGDTASLSLEALPLPYRTAEWPMAKLPRAGAERRDDVCRALLEAAIATRPDTKALQIHRDRQRQVRRGGEWIVVHDPELFHECTRSSGSP